MSVARGTGDNSRLHAFDNVRGLAASAVVALHASYAYALFPLPGLVWPVPIDQPSRVADALFWATEGSVMPLFFTLSGYFLARSLTAQSAAKVLRGRTRRLLLPTVTVGLAVLAVDLHVWVLGLIATDRATVREYRRLKFAPEIHSDLFGPAHLWYVEYLWIICSIVCGAVWLARGFRRRTGAGQPATLSMVRMESRSITAALGVTVLSLGIAFILSCAPQVVLGFQHGWLPDAAKLAHATLFLLLGITLYHSAAMIDAARRMAPLLLATAVVVFAVLLPRIHAAMANDVSTAFDASLGSLLAIFAVTATLGQIGAGLRWLDRPHAALTRLANASFWIYLVHHPLLGLFQIAVRPVPLPAIAKCAFVFACTVWICRWSFERFAAQGAIGRLLDGEMPWRVAGTSKTDHRPVETRKAA